MLRPLLLRPAATAVASSSILLAMLTGCPGSGGSSSGTGGGGTCGGYYDALVSYFERCQGSSEGLDSARPRFEELCAKALTAPGASNLSGQVASCSAQISSATCSDDFDCVDGAGDLPDATACAEGYQCKSGFCKKAKDASCGSCAPKVAIGGACDSGSSDECVEDARCVQTGSGSGPLTGKCTAIKKAKAGEPCGGSSGAEIIQCDRGLNCFFKPGGSSTDKPVCRAPVGDGQECGSRSDCTTGLSCIKDKCTAPLAEGAVCESLDGGCGKGLQCDKTCKRVIRVKGGEDCDQIRQCERGRCKGMAFSTTPDGTTITPGKCIDPLPDGAACTKADSSSEESPPPCDVFAECVGGKCTVPDPNACK